MFLQDKCCNSFPFNAVFELTYLLICISRYVFVYQSTYALEVKYYE